MISDKEILQAALVGLEVQRRHIEDTIIEIRRRITGGAALSPVKEIAAPKTKKRKKRVMSAEAKVKIAAAQKKRWTAYHKEQKAKAAKAA